MAAYDVPYMQRTRDYYRAQGYSRDYRWAHNEEAPFQPLAKPIAASTLAVITTAMPDTEEGRQQRAVYSMPSTPEPDSMYTAELSWDKSATHTEDVNSFLPLRQLQDLIEAGKLGALTKHFYSVPTTYSQRATMETDAPEILRRCQQDGADIALLVPL
jgi:D-proline reductase (dithiol) PrdB